MSINDDLSDIVLDKEGNIDTQKLEKSLKNALEFDVKYKQRDNMKKRACKVASNYDEFKAMVDCAHLKTLSRRDIESLKELKRGWQKRTSNIAGATILAEEQKSKMKSNKSSGMVLSSSFTPPKTPLELDRDFRRLPNDTERKRYLANIGIEVIVKLLDVDPDAELFETILRSMVCADSDSKESDVENAILKDIDMIQWLVLLSKLSKFELLYRFVDKSVKEQILLIFSKSNDQNTNIDTSVINTFKL